MHFRKEIKEGSEIEDGITKGQITDRKRKANGQIKDDIYPLSIRQLSVCCPLPILSILGFQLWCISRQTCIVRLLVPGRKVGKSRVSRQLYTYGVVLISRIDLLGMDIAQHLYVKLVLFFHKSMMLYQRGLPRVSWTTRLKMRCHLNNSQLGTNLIKPSKHT